MLPLLSKTGTLLYAIDGPGLEPPHKSATTSVQKNIKGSAIVFHVMPSVWYTGTVAEMLFETHFELDIGPRSTVGTLTHCRPQTSPMCWLNCRKGSNATCRLLGLTTAAGCWQEPGASGLELEVGSQKPRRRGESEPPPRPHWLSHQRQTLSSSVWEGGKSCFHFLSQSSRTVAHRQEETEKPCPPASHKLLKSKVLEEVGGGTPLNKHSLPEKTPAVREEQEPRTCYQSTLQPWVSDTFSPPPPPPSVKWR